MIYSNCRTFIYGYICIKLYYYSMTLYKLHCCHITLLVHYTAHLYCIRVQTTQWSVRKVRQIWSRKYRELSELSAASAFVINNDCFGLGVRYLVRDATCGFSSNVPALVPSLEVSELFSAFDTIIYFLVIFQLGPENLIFGAGNPLAVRHFDSSLSSDMILKIPKMYIMITMCTMILSICQSVPGCHGVA